MSDMEKELIKLKGTGDGVRIYLDADSSISELTNSLYEKLRRFRKFFGDGHCNIYFAGRKLTASDKMRLEAIVSAMLPEGIVNYGDGKRVRDEQIIEKTLELPQEKLEEELQKKEEEKKPFDDIKDVVTSNFKSSRARLYEGVARSGKTVESDGHLVLAGSALEGSRLIAAGNIIVLGSLRGKAHAGCRGSDGAYVIALDCAPEDIKISTVRARFDKSDFNGGAKRAYLMDGKIIAEDFPVSYEEEAEE